ncbi:MAG TPA: ornithine carbamoyltransferase [Candidatus Marinimicrobia bacterium]|nr:ornithine carbamoyltransferase [Candidatus Neomarinimicrobiota bacterium]
MSFNVKGRHLLTLKDYSPEEILFLVRLAEKLKADKYAGIFAENLKHKNIALIFEKTSTRTRCAFVVAAVDEGAHPEFLGKNDIQLGKKESVADTARVLGRMFDGIQFRGFSHSTVETLAEYAGVPVWNGLTDKYHPTQVLADLLTIREQLGHLKGVRLAYVGDGRNNMANSLMIGAAKMGMDFRIGAPASLFPEQSLVDEMKAVSQETGGNILLTEDPREAVAQADVIYTDVWVSMGEESEFETRIKDLKPYQVDKKLLDSTGNAETIFLHCLPAFHDRNTLVGEEIYQKYGLKAMEVTDDVILSPASRVWDQAENRVHTIKAVMVATLGK